MIATTEDDYVRELQDDRATAVWVATLSDGTTVYQDDGRPGVHPHSAWVRLAAHCRETGKKIVGMRVKFRSNHTPVLPAKAAGYFFCKSAGGFWTGGGTIQSYLVGTLVGDQVRLQKWSVPSLILLDQEIRPADNAGEALIRNENDSERESLLRAATTSSRTGIRADPARPNAVPHS